MTERKFRLVTRSDFDGLICAVLLKELNLIEEIKKRQYGETKDNDQIKFAILKEIIVLYILFNSRLLYHFQFVL